MTISLDSTLNPQSPPEIREIQEIAIALSARTLNPTMVSEDFLKFSGIVPSDWELAKQPILNPNLAQVTFQNGVSIVAQPRTITFVEVIGVKEATDLKIPAIARQYIEKLPHADYQGLSIAPKSVIPFPGGPDAARKYITGTLLSPGPWQEFGQAPLQAGLNLLYELGRCQLSLSINEAKLQIAERESMAALLFSASFNYNITSNNELERLKQLVEGIAQWQSDLDAFREIVHQRFLGQQASVFPSNLTG
jgi:hypothetical protein